MKSRILSGVALLDVTVGTALADDPVGETTVSDTDLSAPFRTKTKWRLVISQEPATEDNLGHGDLHFCFIHDGKPSCQVSEIPVCTLLDGKPDYKPTAGGVESWSIYNDFDDTSVYQPKAGTAGPLLVVNAGGFSGGPSYPNGPIIWAYRPETDSFEQILLAWGSPNTNGEARFVTDGPLAGAVIVDEATDHRPYGYRITVYQLLKTNHYKQILRYDGNTRYGDGNPLAVIDSEMPETLRRLNLWHPSDPLPTPARMPAQCKTLELRHGAEWCR